MKVQDVVLDIKRSNLQHGSKLILLRLVEEWACKDLDKKGVEQ